MAFTPATLFRMTGGNKPNGPSMWLYKTTDDVITVPAAGYFVGGAALGMHVADVVMITGAVQNKVSIGRVSAIDVSGNATVFTFL